jgi:hypothetical protein
VRLQARCRTVGADSGVRDRGTLQRPKHVNDQRRLADRQQRARAEPFERRTGPRVAAGENDREDRTRTEQKTWSIQTEASQAFTP